MSPLWCGWSGQRKGGLGLEYASRRSRAEGGNVVSGFLVIDGNRITRALTLAHAEIERLRAGEGNPNHADDGKFASHPGAHGGQHGKHFAKRQRRKARRQERLKQLHKQGKADLAAVRKTHKGERKDLLKEHRAERKDVPKDWRKDVKEHHKTVKEDHADLRSQHRTERREMVASQRTERAETAKQHHAEKRDQQHEHAVEARQSRKDVDAFSSKEKLEARHQAEQQEHGKSMAKVMEDAPKIQAKTLEVQAAKGASPAKLAFLKREHAKQNEEMYKNISKRGEALEAKHASEKREHAEHGNAKRVEAHKAMEERHAQAKKELADEHSERKTELNNEVGALRDTHADERKSLKSQHNEARKNLREEYQARKEDQRSDHAEQRKDLRDTQREERRDEIKRIKDDLRDEFPRRKSQRTASDAGRSIQGDAIGLSLDVGINRAFAPTRTSKASSAEAILRYCLRQRGWTRAYREGLLSGKQRLDLLHDMREYGRAWLRHEAAELFAAHGRHDDNLMVDRDGLPDAAFGLVNGGIDRALGAAIKHHVGRFFRRAKQFTRELILAGTLALSEPKPLDAEDLEQVNRQAVEQERYFDAFEAEVNALPPPQLAPDLGLNQVTIIVPPSMSMPQFIARAEQYGSAVWGAAQEVARAQVIRERVWVEERRVHGMLKDDMCSICREAVAAGWQPIGTLPAIGDSECLSSCHCYFKWRDAEGKEKSQVRRIRRKPGAARIRRPVVQEA